VTEFFGRNETLAHLSFACAEMLSARTPGNSKRSLHSRATRHSSRETTLGSPCLFVFMMFSPLRIHGDIGVQRIPFSQ
jgi:hypothetical protein